MSIRFCMSLASLTVSVSCRYEHVKNMCSAYIIPDVSEPDISASCTDAEIAAEIALLEGTSPQNAEFLCIYRSIARVLPSFNRAVFHGAAITYLSNGFLFTAPSGTGKSTHIKLWRKYLGDSVKIVNGDKPIIAADKNGVTVYGTPWAGKENWQRNTSAPLKGICVLKQGTDNKIRPLSKEESVSAFMRQIYLPDFENALADTLSVLDAIIRNVPVFELSCDISENAVIASFEALTGDKYKNKGI